MNTLYCISFQLPIYKTRISWYRYANDDNQATELGMRLAKREYGDIENFHVQKISEE